MKKHTICIHKLIYYIVLRITVRIYIKHRELRHILISSKDVLIFFGAWTPVFKYIYHDLYIPSVYLTPPIGSGF